MQLCKKRTFSIIFITGERIDIVHVLRGIRAYIGTIIGELDMLVDPDNGAAVGV